jgi:hypothetical protein
MVHSELHWLVPIEAGRRAEMRSICSGLKLGVSRIAPAPLHLRVHEETQRVRSAERRVCEVLRCMQMQFLIGAL